ncbi:Flp family type IVb pilin [Methylobacterium sp. P31]
MDEPSCGRAETGLMRIRSQSGFAGRMIAWGTRFARDVRGSTAIEYALIGSLIFVVAIGSIRYYASRMNGVYSQINTAVTQSN